MPVQGRRVKISGTDVDTDPAARFRIDRPSPAFVERLAVHATQALGVASDVIDRMCIVTPRIT